MASQVPRTTEDETARLALGEVCDGDRWQRLAHAPESEAMLAPVLALAAQARREPLPELPGELYEDYDRTGDRARFETPYFERRRRLAALAIEALLDPGAETGTLAAAMHALCDEHRWAVPAHIRPPVSGHGWDPDLTLDLFATETGSALAEIAGLLAPRLPGELVARVRAEVRRRIIGPYERHTWWWESSPNNWAAVCAAAVALAAAQVCTRTELDGLAPRLRASLRRSLDGYGEDGVCVEGFGYWTYGFGYYLVGVTALDAVLGPDEAAEPARAAEAARWPRRAVLSRGVVVPFADSSLENRAAVGLLAQCHRRYGRVSAPAGLAPAEVLDDCGRWATAVRGLVWHPVATAGATGTGGGLPGRQHPGEDLRPTWFPDAQWLLVPQGPHSPIGFAARAGHNGEPHNHNDLGTFVIAADGELLLADGGRGVYDKQYFGQDRYENPAAGSHGHSAPLVDGTVQRAGAEAVAEVRLVEIGPDGTGEVLDVDLTAAYGHPHLRSLRRRIRRTGEAVTVVDTLAADAPVKLTQRFVTLIEPKVIAPGEVQLAGRRRVAVLRHDPAVTAVVGRFAVGRGSFPVQLYYVDLPDEAATEVSATVQIVVGRA